MEWLQRHAFLSLLLWLRHRAESSSKQNPWGVSQGWKASYGKHLFLDSKVEPE